MSRPKLDDLGDEKGSRIRVYYPWNTPPRTFVTTGTSRPTTSKGPCQFDWELIDPDMGVKEWVPGWYVVSRAKR